MEHAENLDDLAARERVALELAEEASNPMVAQLHRQMAKEYLRALNLRRRNPRFTKSAPAPLANQT